jgi:hypothetical protein
MKTVLLFVSTSAIIVSAGLGAVVEWGASITNGFSVADGSNLPDNSFLRVGFFDITDGIIAQNAGNTPFLDSHFIEFGNARIGDNLGDINGHFSKSSQADTGSTGLNLAGRQIYLWAFASTDNSSPAASLLTATQQGIYYVDLASDPDWAFPVQDPVPQNTTIDLSDLTLPGNAGVLSPAAHVVVGNFPVGVSSTTGAPDFGLVVPEPASALLAFVGANALLIRRRRRTK